MGIEDEFEDAVDEEVSEFDFDAVGTLDEEMENDVKEKVKPKAVKNRINKKLESENKSFKKENEELKEKLNLNSEKSIDAYKTATKSITKLNENLEEIDYSLSNFNRFQQNIKTFKVWNTVVFSFSGLIIGLIIAFFSMSELYDFKIEKQLDEYSEFGRIMIENGFQLSNTDSNIQVHIDENLGAVMFKSNQFLVIEIKK